MTKEGLKKTEGVNANFLKLHMLFSESLPLLRLKINYTYSVFFQFINP